MTATPAATNANLAARVVDSAAFTIAANKDAATEVATRPSGRVPATPSFAPGAG